MIAAMALLLAQSPPANTPPKTGTFTGAVRDSVSNAPLAGVHVVFESTTTGFRHATDSDAEGNYTLRNLPAAVYRAVPALRGFAAIPATSTRPNLHQAKVGETQRIDLKLAPEATITGRVFNSDREPLSRVLVDVSRGGQFRDGRYTNEKGEFRITGLAPGSYRLRATPPPSFVAPEIRTDGSTELQLVAKYFPNAEDPEQASWIEVQPGATVSAVEFQLDARPLLHAQARLAGPNTNAKSVRWRLRWNRQVVPAQPTLANGSYTFWRLSPGSYDLTAFGSGEGGVNLTSACVKFKISESSVDGLEASPYPAFPLTGRVVWKNPLPEGFPTNQVVVSISSDDQSAGSYSARIAQDSAFRFPSVSPGVYAVRLFGGPASAYVPSVYLGSIEAQDQTLDLSKPPGIDEVRINVNDDGAELSGIVRDSSGTPVPDAAVILLADKPDSMRVRSTGSDVNGRYSFRGLAPGVYRTAVVEPRSLGDITISGSLGIYEPQAQRIDLKSNDKVTRDLKKPGRP
jgi:large repetitive protein